MRRWQRAVVSALVLALSFAALWVHYSRPSRPHSMVSLGINARGADDRAGIDGAGSQPIRPLAANSAPPRNPSRSDIAEYRREATCRHYRNVLPFTGDRNQLAKEYLADDANFTHPEQPQHSSDIMDALDANQVFVDAHAADCADAPVLPDETFFADALVAAQAGDIEAGNCWLRDWLDNHPSTAMQDGTFQTLLQSSLERGDWSVVDMLEGPIRLSGKRRPAMARMAQGAYTDPSREYRFALLARYGVGDVERGRILDGRLETQRAALNPQIADEAAQWAAETYRRWFQNVPQVRSQCPGQ